MIRTAIVTSVLAAVPAARAQDAFELAPGFRCERASAETRSFLALTFDDRGRLVLATEDDGLLSAVDEDGDGFFEDVVTLAAEIVGAQGLAWTHDGLYVVGRRTRDGGPPRSGLWRLDLDSEGRTATDIDLVIGIDDDDEHGAHAVVLGPDGLLYVAVGDHARFETEPSGGWPESRSDSLLPPIQDPGGFGVRRRPPYGHVARVVPRTGAWSLHSTGYRNHYDLAFTESGELFTVDSDMEWNVGLPWYRPVRALLCVPGGDYGSRSGSATLPEYLPDSLPSIASLGRGSPTGLVAYEHDRFPEEYRGALILGDWANATVIALRLVPDGGGYEALPTTILRAKGALNVTDLEVGPDGAVYFATGGRGTRGAVWRLEYADSGPTDAADGDPFERALAMPQPRSARTRGTAFELSDRMGADWLGAATDVLFDPERPDVERLRAWNLLEMRGGTVDAWPRFAEDPSPLLRMQAADRLATAPAELRATVGERLVRDPDGRVARRAWSALAEAEGFARERWEPSSDRWVRHAERRAFARHGGDRDWSGAGSFFETVVSSLDDPDELARAMAGLDGETGLDLEVLRAIELARIAGWTPTEARRRGWVAQLLDLFPSGDKALDRELAKHLAIDADATGGRALDELLAELERTPSRDAAIHYAYCLRAIAGDWSPARREQLLAWFEEAAAWTGGGSFRGYLHAMLSSVIDGMSTEECLALAGELGPTALAAVVSRKDPEVVAALFDPLRAAFDALGEAEDTALALEQRRSILRSLRGARVAGLDGWLRSIHADEPALADDALLLLAERPDPADWERLVAGLDRGRHEVRDACIEALAGIPRKATDADSLRRLLDGMRELGPRGGYKLWRVLAHWTDRPRPPRDDGEWTTRLDEWERWFDRTFPDYVRTEAGPETGPEWDFEWVAGFLGRTTGRAASTVRGAELYQRANCQTCHTLSGTGTGWGPDLTGVTKRLARRDLLEAILFPSREVADRYRTTLAATHDGRIVEGRLVEDAPARLTFLDAGGGRTTLSRADVVALRPSEVSAMPDGLLEGLTLEETRDLFAFLEADGVVDPEDRRGEGWIDLLSDERRGLWGGDLRGWRLTENVLVGRAENIAPNRYLLTKDTFRDFELEFDVHAVDGNSGVQYRSRAARGPDPVGYQADIGQAYWGSLYATDGRGLIAGPAREALRDSIQWKGWNHYYVRVEGDRHVIEINGHPMIDATDAEHADGVLGFQLHQKLDMTVYFANLRLRRCTD